MPIADEGHPARKLSKLDRMPGGTGRPEPFQPRPTSGSQGVLLGKGDKLSSGGTRTVSLQDSSRGVVATGTSQKARVASNQGSNYRDSNGNGNVVLGPGQKVSSGGRKEVRYLNEGEGERSSEDEPRSGAPAGAGNAAGYGGIEAFKEKGWRRFF
ncbi:MAG: hypothetical protein Q9167_005543 [Letrouitia subvulpina]